jgi:hypothetical protein
MKLMHQRRKRSSEWVWVIITILSFFYLISVALRDPEFLSFWAFWYQVFSYLSAITAIVTVVIQGIIHRSFRVSVKCFVGASFGWIISTTAALAGLLLLEDITWFIQNIFALETVTPSSTTDWDPDLAPGLALLALVQIAIAIATAIGGLKQVPKLKTR